MASRNIEWRIRTIGPGIFLTNSLQVYEVNSTAAKIFLMCNGSNSLEMIVDGIKTSFQTSQSDLELKDDVLETLKLLIEIGAVQENP